MVSSLVHLALWFNTMAIWIRVGIQFVRPGDRSLYSYCKAFKIRNVCNSKSSDSNDIPFSLSSNDISSLRDLRRRV